MLLFDREGFLGSQIIQQVRFAKRFWLSENRISLRDGVQPAIFSIAILGGLFGDYVEYPVGPAFFLGTYPFLWVDGRLG